jgi:hypothetical protein
MPFISALPDPLLFLQLQLASLLENHFSWLLSLLPYLPDSSSFLPTSGITPSFPVTCIACEPGAQSQVVISRPEYLQTHDLALSLDITHIRWTGLARGKYLWVPRVSAS